MICISILTLSEIMIKTKKYLLLYIDHVDVPVILYKTNIQKMWFQIRTGVFFFIRDHRKKD